MKYPKRSQYKYAKSRYRVRNWAEYEAGFQKRGALVHGSELRTDAPSPERGSRHSVAVGHTETGHRVEDLARQLHLDSLSSEGSTSHPSTDDRLVTVHGVLYHAALAVA